MQGKMAVLVPILVVVIALIGCLICAIYRHEPKHEQLYQEKQQAVPAAPQNGSPPGRRGTWEAALDSVKAPSTFADLEVELSALPATGPPAPEALPPTPMLLNNEPEEEAEVLHPANSELFRFFDLTADYLGDERWDHSRKSTRKGKKEKVGFSESVSVGWTYDAISGKDFRSPVNRGRYTPLTMEEDQTLGPLHERRKENTQRRQLAQAMAAAAAANDSKPEIQHQASMTRAYSDSINGRVSPEKYTDSMNPPDGLNLSAGEYLLKLGGVQDGEQGGGQAYDPFEDVQISLLETDRGQGDSQLKQAQQGEGAKELQLEILPAPFQAHEWQEDPDGLVSWSFSSEEQEHAQAQEEEQKLEHDLELERGALARERRELMRRKSEREEQELKLERGALERERRELVRRKSEEQGQRQAQQRLQEQELINSSNSNSSNSSSSSLSGGSFTDSMDGGYSSGSVSAATSPPVQPDYHQQTDRRREIEITPSDPLRQIQEPSPPLPLPSPGRSPRRNGGAGVNTGASNTGSILERIEGRVSTARYRDTMVDVPSPSRGEDGAGARAAGSKYRKLWADDRTTAAL